jgi:hypothetical protein
MRVVKHRSDESLRYAMLGMRASVDEYGVSLEEVLLRGASIDVRGVMASAWDNRLSRQLWIGEATHGGR